MTDEQSTETDSLRALAADVDANPHAESVSDETPPSRAETVTNEPKPPEEAKGQTPAEGQKTSTESADTAAEEKKSRYVREKERAAKTWQEINAEKETLKREREEFATAKAQAKAAQPLKDEDGFAAKDYAAAAKRATSDAKALRAKAKEALDAFDEEAAAGYKAQAEEADAWAEKHEGRAKQLQQSEQQQANEAAQGKWVGYLEEFAKTEPDIAADLKAGKVESPLGKLIGQAIKELPGLANFPEGIKYAYRIAKGDLLTAAVPALNKQIEELTKKNAELTKLTSLTGSPPARRSEAGSPTELTADNMLRMAQEYDEEHRGFGT